MEADGQSRGAEKKSPVIMVDKGVAAAEELFAVGTRQLGLSEFDADLAVLRLAWRY